MILQVDEESLEDLYCKKYKSKMELLDGFNKAYKRILI